MQLGRSVFGTTIEVFRLFELGLLVVPGRPPTARSRAGRGHVIPTRRIRRERQRCITNRPTDPVTEELRLIRHNVPGIRGSITATS